jgi:tetratricopeptide (TPR) repeat protein
LGRTPKKKRGVNEDAMRSELASILADPSFVRSPVLARLLRYLVDTTLKGEGAALKSYSVAVEGLGRSADFDSQVDTYARVQVARLRKALDVFYASAGAGRPHRLEVASGSYEVSLVSNGACFAPAPQPTSEQARAPFVFPRWWLAPRKWLGVAIAALLLVLAGSWKWYADYREDQWRTPNFPWVEVEVEGAGEDLFPKEQVEDVRQTMMVSLSRYEGLRVRFNPGGEKADYEVHIEIEVVDGALREEVFVVYSALNRVVWSDVRELGTDRASWRNDIDAYHEQLVFRLAHSSGSIHAFERHWNHSATTPYGCWLRFSAQLQENRDYFDGAMKNCAARWYGAAPGHTLAASLEGWVLLDESMGALTEAGRMAKIKKAVVLLERNATLNPESTFAHVSLMRAYNYMRDYHAALDAGTEAISINPANLDVRGMVGTTMALNNDPRGEVMVKDVIAQHFNPPSWYFLGSFVGAMMRDDTASARLALRRVSEFNHTLPVLDILSAALEARTGHIAQARAHWKRAKALHPILKVDHQLLFDRLPIAPAVRKRLLQWLRPVLD